MSHVGRLLVATPLIGDPNFERTVVFVVDHDLDGSYGIVLNRPTETAVGDVAAGWERFAAAPGVLFVGGPVKQDSVIGLARKPADGVVHGSIGMGVEIGDVVTVDLHAAPEPGEPPWPGLRFFAGSAGWAAGQLEAELFEGAWWAVDGGADDVFSTDPTGLWARVLRRQTGQTAWFADYPTDLSAN